MFYGVKIRSGLKNGFEDVRESLSRICMWKITKKKLRVQLSFPTDIISNDLWDGCTEIICEINTLLQISGQTWNSI